jgi:glycosyltransferase involved in cell wall biosynthesis
MRAVIVSPDYLDPNRRGKLRALTGLGCALTVATPGGESGIDGGVRFAPVPARGDRGQPERLAWSRRALAALLRDVQPELVQIEAEPASQVAVATTAEARKLGVPTVAFSWESLPRAWSWLERRRRRTTLSGAAGVIGGSIAATALLRAEAPTAVHTVIPQFGLSLPAPIPRVTRDGLAIGFVGRLVPERGADLLFRACNQVMGHWSLAVVGTGPEQETLEELAQRLGLSSRLRWVGGAGRAEIAQLWQDIDVLVVPSRATPEWVERFNPLLIEAMAHGVTAVVMNTGALPEQVGDAGMVATDVESLALALQRLLAEPVLRQRLGDAGRRRAVAWYGETPVAEQTLAFWQEVVTAHARQITSADGVVA